MRGKKWLAPTLLTGVIVIAVGLVVGGALGFATGAAIGAAVSDTGRECHFEECVDPGILPGAAIGFIVGALVGGVGMATLWFRRLWRADEPANTTGGGAEPAATGPTSHVTR